MNKKSKITLAALSVFLLVVIGVILVTVFGKSDTVFGEYSYQSSLRQFDTVEDIVLDGKKDDSVWKKINPYVRETKAENRDASKYKHLASRVDECKVEVYTHLGEEGLFVYATTDEPVVNTTSYNPFATTAFDFYLASRDVLSRIDNLFELGITAENTARLRVRTIDANTEKETWKYIPCVGLKSEAVINEVGYSVEFFVPWSTFNMDEKPEYLSMATALSRRVDESSEAERYWEMLDANTESIGFVNYTTYPLFDKTGYVEFAKGENFEFVHSSIIDFSKDKGDDPSVTTLNISTVAASFEMEPVKDVYWETTVKINDFNHTDDPRVGIMLKGEKKEDGSFDRVYLMFQLDKEHEGEGYTIKNALMLPSNSKAGNEWTKSQTYLLDSHVKNEEFKLAVLKQNGKFYFYLDDVLLSIRDDIKDFNADSKVTCGIVSWYTGATFSDYNMTTSGLNAIKNKKTDIFVADENFTNIRMDMLTEAKGYIWADTQKTNQSTIHFNQSLSKNFYLSTTLSDVKPYKDATDSRNGIVLTKDMNGGYRRIVFAMMAPDKENLSRLQILMFDNDELGDNWSKVTNIDAINFSARSKAELSIAVTGNIVKVYIDGTFATAISLADYGMQNPTKVGLTSWKGRVKFSNISLTTETKDSSSLVTDVNASRTILPLMEAEAIDVYAETNIVVSDTSTSMWPRVGLRLRNAAGENVDYVLSYDKSKNLLYAVVVRVNAKGADVSEQQCYAITSAEASIQKTGIKLAVAKVGGTISFYANDVLLGTKTYEGFGANDAVTARLYSKGTASTFTNYSAITDKAEIEKTIASCADTFVPDPNKISIKFDLLNEENATEPKITTNENGAWAKSSIVNWNGVSADKFYTESTIELTGNNNKDGTVASAGIVLTSGDNRFFVMLSGDEKEVIRVQCVSMTKDIFDGYNAEKYPNGKVYEYSGKVSLTGEIKLGVYRDGNALYVLVNDELQQKFDLSAVTYPITGASLVGFAGWKSQATFTDYSIKLGSECPTLGDTFLLATNASSARGVVKKVVYTDANVAEVEAKIAGTSTNHGYMYLEEADTKVFAETNVSLIDSDGQVDGDDLRVGIALKAVDNKKVLGIYLHAKDSGDVDMLEIYNMENDESNAGWIRTEIPLSGVSKENIELSVARQGSDLAVYVNNSIVIATLSDYTSYPIVATEATYIGFDVMQGSAVYSDYTYAVGEDCSTLEDTMALTANANKSKYAQIVIPDAEEKEDFKIQMKSASSKDHAYLYFNETSTKVFAETYLNITGTSGDQRVGFGLQNADGDAIIGIYLHATGSGDVDKLEIVNLDNHKRSSAIWPSNTKATLPDNVGRENIKLAVLRDGNDLVVYVNDTVVYSTQLSKYTTYPIAGDEATRVGVQVYQGSGNFYDYSTATPGKTMVLATTAALTNYATQKEVTSNNELNIDVEMKAATSRDHGYMYFAKTGTSVYAETYLSIKGTSGDQRAGLALKSKSGNAIVGLYLHANGTGDVDKLEIVNLDAHKRSSTIWASNTKVTLPENIGRTNIKLGLLRNGNNLIVYVNDSAVYTTSLANYKTYPIAATAETYIGISVYQGNATFSNYSVPEVFASDVSKGTQVLALNSVASKDIYAEAMIVPIATKNGVWPRVGFRMTNSSGTVVDYYMGFSNDGTSNFIEISSTGNSNYSVSAYKDLAATGLKLAVRKQGDQFYFYVNGVQWGTTKTYDGFGADDAVTVSLYSKNTESIFYNYLCE